MHSYTDIDGVPAAGDRELLTGLLRDELGFDGVVVSDYYGISFLETLHAVAASPAQAAALALGAGVDVELPNVALLRRRAGRRGDLRPGARGTGGPRRGPGAAAEVRARPARSRLARPDVAPATSNGEDLDLDPPAHRELARRLAEESVVLLANRAGALPLRPRPGSP